MDNYIVILCIKIKNQITRKDIAKATKNKSFVLIKHL